MRIDLKMELCAILPFFIAVSCLLASGVHALWDTSAADIVTDDQCDVAVREVMNEDRATVVDDSSSRLHAVWISQECEIRAGPEFVIRKYTFFENNTFVLMRHYYAEESCSIATHSVTARGVIKMLDNSLVTPGATEARYHLDTVHISPLNRQVAHKLGHRVNVSCGPQARWRPYVAQLIYERGPESARRYGSSYGHGSSSSSWQGPRYNSLQGHEAVAASSSSGLLHRHNGKSVNCLAPLGIEFDELRLLRVQRRPMGFRSASFGTSERSKVELFFGSLPPNLASKRAHRPTSLQPTALLRTDAIQNCPICGAISRGTENSPPLLHEVVALPALIGGSWISTSCESHPGGIWLRRQLRVYAGDKLWTGRWDYFSDSRCLNFLYGITAAGSYVQRSRRHRRHETSSVNDDLLIEEDILTRARRQTDKLAKNSKKIVRKNVSKKDFLADKNKDRDSLEIDRRQAGKDSSEFDLATVERLKQNSPFAVSRRMQSLGERKLKLGTYYEVADNEMSQSRRRRSLDEVDYYRHLLQNAQPSMAESFAAMLRGNQRREETTKKPVQSPTPAGTTELDLHVAESLLIAGDLSLARRCGAALVDGSNVIKTPRLSSWPATCVPHSLDAPSTLGLRARISVDWYGQYTLLLGAKDSGLWDAPLLQCGPTSMKNPLLRSHLRRSVGLRFGILFNAAGRTASEYNVGLLVLIQIIILFLSNRVIR